MGVSEQRRSRLIGRKCHTYKGQIYTTNTRRRCVTTGNMIPYRVLRAGCTGCKKQTPGQLGLQEINGTHETWRGKRETIAGWQGQSICSVFSYQKMDTVFCKHLLLSSINLSSFVMNKCHRQKYCEPKSRRLLFEVLSQDIFIRTWST